MAGMGLEAAGGLSALQAMLRQRIMDQIAEQERTRKAGVEQQELGLRSRQIGAQEDATTFNQQRALKQDADAAAGVRAQDAYIASQPPEVQPVLRGRLTLKQPSLSSHDLEPPSAHQAHVTADDQAKRKADIGDYETKEKIQAKYRAPAKPEKERLVQVMGPNGVTTWVRESDAVGKPAAQAPRAVTGQERQTLGYFNRMLEAERNARAVEGQVSGKDIAAGQYAPGWLENWLKSPEGQKYTQAQRMYTEARLRKESGAAIPENEFANDRKMNFRAAGDAPDAIGQKRRSRLETMRGIGNSAGRALQEYYGEGSSLDDLLKEFAEQGDGPQRRPIPGIPGAEAELQNGKWIRVK